MSDWTPSDDATLKELWLSGHAASAIGRKLNRTRNSVIGRVHRKGLTRRPTGNRPRHRIVRNPKPPKLRLAQNCEPRQVSIVALMANECKYATAEIQGQHLFCGCPTEEFQSYCPAHRKVAYQAMKPRHIKSPWEHSVMKVAA